MAIARDARPYSRRFIEVNCPCGRTLRAGFESAGATIQCWQCKAAVPVPIPKTPMLAARVLLRAFRDVFAWSILGAVALGVAALVFLLVLPLPGWLVGAIALS